MAWSLWNAFTEVFKTVNPHTALRRGEAFLGNLVAFANLQEVFFLWRPTLPDPDDDLVLEVAVAAGCRYIVTHNLRHFRGVEEWGVTALTPGDFLRILRNDI